MLYYNILLNVNNYTDLDYRSLLKIRIICINFNWNFKLKHG